MTGLAKTQEDGFAYRDERGQPQWQSCGRTKMDDPKTKLDALSAEATQGEWFTDTEKSEGEYGFGPDKHSGFLVSVLYGPDGKSLFDPHNSDMIEVHEDGPDEDGYVSAWDETSRRNAAFIVALVNAYRTGQLIALPAEPDAAMVEVHVSGVIQDVCELPDYQSPDDQPDLLQCTVDELQIIVERHITAACRAVLDHLRENK